MYVLYVIINHELKYVKIKVASKHFFLLKNLFFLKYFSKISKLQVICMYISIINYNINSNKLVTSLRPEFKIFVLCIHVYSFIGM